jgi:hypothetical protein
MTTEEKAQLEAWLVAVGFKYAGTIIQAFGQPVCFWKWSNRTTMTFGNGGVILVKLFAHSGEAVLTFTGSIHDERHTAGPSYFINATEVQANIMALFRDLGELREHSTETAV